MLGGRWFSRGAVHLDIGFNREFQPKAVEQPTQHLEGWVPLAGLNVAERVNRDFSQLCEILLSDTEALPSLSKLCGNHGRQPL